MNMKKILVIYHRADFDGLFCREIAKKFLGDEASYLGWDYGDLVPSVSEDVQVYMLDISIEALMGHPRLIWIDHHKSAIEKYARFIQGYRIDGVAACRLAWQWFWNACHDYPLNAGQENCQLPNRQSFVDRTVMEPYAVQLAGEYDIWDKRNPDAEVFQFGLRGEELTDYRWHQLLSLTVLPNSDVTESQNACLDLIATGNALQRYQQTIDADVMRGRSFTVLFEGLVWLALNTARCNSLTFAALDKPATGHHGLMGFFWNGRAWKVSLYHAKDRTGLDLSVIAQKYGGGGHRGACGFEAKTLPWMSLKQADRQVRPTSPAGE